jgi:sulfite reductase beta subunit-like hemoprotein
MQVPNGELTAEHARFLGGAVRKYGEKGCLDITTRANIQLRGVPLEDAGDIMNGLQDVGLTSVQTGKYLLPMCSYTSVQTGRHLLPMCLYVHAAGIFSTLRG